jgi:nucleoside-diphosphate-sugar epimerase
LLGCAEQVEFGAVPAPANEPALLVGNCRRLAEEINWSPRFDINSGFANTVDWWKRKLSDGL